jgi:ATP-dependent Clp protease protease subunit
MSWFNKLFGKNGQNPVKSEDEISDKLLADRIIFLGSAIDDTVAETVIAKMLFLEHQSPDEDINFYINSPGGSISASFAIYDTIKSIKPDVATICVGQAGGTAAILAAAGCKSKRFAQPSSRFIFFKVKAHKEISLMEQVEKITYQNELKRMKYLVVGTFVKETGQSPKKILAAMKKDTILSADEAIEFGLVDAIVSK